MLIQLNFITFIQNAMYHNIYENIAQTLLYSTNKQQNFNLEFPNLKSNHDPSGFYQIKNLLTKQ